MTHSLRRVSCLEFSPLKRGKVSVGTPADVSANTDVWGWGKKNHQNLKAPFVQDLEWFYQDTQWSEDNSIPENFLALLLQVLENF